MEFRKVAGYMRFRHCRPHETAIVTALPPLRLIPSFAVLLGAAAALLGQSPAQDAARSEAVGSVQADRSFSTWKGAGSCASSACHNINSAEGIKGDRYAKGGEYSVWAGKDPHAKAYSVLFEKQSQRIQKNLDPRGSAAKNLLCLRCHVDPAVDQVADKVWFHDGVGCESCHGGAKNWLVPHVRQEWQKADRDAKESLGFRFTKDLIVRVETCLACHVGGDRAEVNHDLLAAGHPPLQFEFSEFLDRYRAFQHWNEADDRRRNPDHEAKAWTVGQLATARAALLLLRRRAAIVADDRDQERAQSRPWPEFAEYACSSCHHGLEQQRPESPERKPGTTPWASVSSAFTLFSDPSLTPGNVQMEKLLEELRIEMAKRNPEPRKVTGHAERLVEAYSEWLKIHPADKRLSAEELQDRMARLTDARAERLASGGWEDARQLSFALNAHSRSLNFLEDRRDSQRTDSVKRLADRLRVPAGQYTPSEYVSKTVIQDLRAIHERLNGR